MHDTLSVTDKTFSDICRIGTELLGVSIVSAERIGGSGNNRVYILQGERERYIIKFYFHHPSDKRNRLKAEFKSLSFLWEQGIIDIPRPMAVNEEESCAIYEFIEGKKIAPEDISEKDVECAVDFLGRLKKINEIAYAQDFASASDACFSIKAIIANIEARLGRFEPLQGSGQEYGELKSFLCDDYKPLVAGLKKWAQQQCEVSGISFEKEIPLKQRTLSPSDFGFHNAIRANSGRIVFLDFEYFGWDDPAKATVDFLFHPAMALKDPLKKIFVRQMLETFKENSRLIERVRLAYPLFGLKWCMILLNEFVPNDFSRRAYAAAGLLDKAVIQKEQLQKARNLFRYIKKVYMEFPYAS